MNPRSDRAFSLRDRQLWVPLLLLLVLAAAFRFFPLPHEALSGDELFSRRMVVESAARGWTDVRQDLVHPPLYYMLLKGSTLLWGSSAVGIRLLSLLCGLLTLPVLVLVGSRLPGARWAGLLAAACVAVGRYDVYYSQEARSYAMYSLVVLLLVLWLTYLQEPHGTGYWVLGCGLMTTLVYTHYVGGVFVAVAVFSVLISGASRATKLRVFGCGLIAFFLFLPWLIGEAGVYKAKKGIGSNLDWQGHPGFSDLRQVWATSVGVNSFPGATVLALAVALVLSVAALWYLARQGDLRRSPVVLGLACMGWITPLVVFVLSEPPVNLPLFGLRHVLPATLLLALLCAYGVELAARHSGAPTAVLAMGSAVLVLLAADPTLQVLQSGSARYPYDRVEQLVVADEQDGIPAYAVWYYGVGEPVNFYCRRACVQDLPASEAALPRQFVLLYRPSSGTETREYKHLLADGFVDTGHTYFTDGLKTPYGTTAATLRRGTP